MKLADILAFDRELLDESKDTEESTYNDTPITLQDVREFEEDMVEAA